jgi:hypothetical protein
MKSLIKVVLVSICATSTLSHAADNSTNFVGVGLASQFEGLAAILELNDQLQSQDGHGWSLYRNANKLDLKLEDWTVVKNEMQLNYLTYPNAFNFGRELDWNANTLNGPTEDWAVVINEMHINNRTCREALNFGANPTPNFNANKLVVKTQDWAVVQKGLFKFQLNCTTF